jgi:hypothetical protein
MSAARGATRKAKTPTPDEIESLARRDGPFKDITVAELLKKRHELLKRLLESDAKMMNPLYKEEEDLRSTRKADTLFFETIHRHLMHRTSEMTIDERVLFNRYKELEKLLVTGGLLPPPPKTRRKTTGPSKLSKAGRKTRRATRRH